MVRFLITGARASVALHLLRLLAGAGHVVHLADSLRHPLAAASVLQRLIRDLRIDCVIPTCEEVLYLGQIWRDHPMPRCWKRSITNTGSSRFAMPAAAARDGDLHPLATGREAAQQALWVKWVWVASRMFSATSTNRPRALLLTRRRTGDWPAITCE
jgi:hypothetical protein